MRAFDPIRPPALIDRCADGPAMFTYGKTRTMLAPALPNLWGDTAEFVRAREHYNHRHQPELYHDTELIEDYRANLSAALDMYDLDCHRCRISVFTDSINGTCPMCKRLLG